MRLLAFTVALSLAACASDPLPPPPRASAPEPAPTEASAPADTAEAPPAPVGPATLADWAGERAVRDDGLRFVSDDAVRPKLVEALSVEPGVLDLLEGNTGLYDTDRVTRVGDMLAVAYRATAASPDRRPLYLLVHAETGNVHAVLTRGGDTFYRRSYASTADDLSPQAVDWMQAQSGVDVMAMAIQSDQEVLGP